MAAWGVSATVASLIAVAGATSVLAEDPACVVDGHPVSASELAADPTLCPAPAAEPAAAPAPAPAPDPAPAPAADPAPAPATEPAPSADPAPAADPAATPAAPAADPAAPVTETPAAADPGATTPTSAEPAATTDAAPATPTTTTPAPTTPATETPTAPTATEPTRTPTSLHPRPRLTPAQQRAHAALARANARAAAERAAAAAEADDATPSGGDARQYREAYTPVGKIPEQPRAAAADAALLTDAAKGTGTDWSLLAAIAWQESRFDDPSSGLLVGRHLTDAAWKAYGRDGDGDGHVLRSDRADQARTVATYLATARSTPTASLRAYYTGIHSGFHSRRALFLADYFDALGTTALVKGISDDAAKQEIADRVLADGDVDIYDAGRSDIEAGLIDPRVLVTVEFLRARFGSVHVTCLTSGHSIYTKGGNVSDHAVGRAVDIGALGGQVITASTQTRGSNIWRSIRELLLLPNAAQASQVISLWDMGGASFALPDHDDHLHIGFSEEPATS